MSDEQIRRCEACEAEGKHEHRGGLPCSAVSLQTHTEGGIVRPGETVLEIVPSADQLVVEARIRPEDIDRVEVGLNAGVKLTAYQQRTSPELDGTLIYVSADIIEDERTGLTYFLARIEVPETEIAKLDQRRVQPGMIADVYIRTGELTPAQYLLQPLTDSLRKAWRES